MSAEQQVMEAPEQNAPSAQQNRGDSRQQDTQRSESSRSESSQSGSDGDDGGSYEVGEDGQRREPGTGQSKSSRRRRRKRKGKSEDGTGQAADGTTGEAGGESVSSMQGNDQEGSAAPMVLPGESISARQSTGIGNVSAGNGNSMNGSAASAPQQQQPRGFNGSGQAQNGQNSNAPGGTKRWKKKNFRERDRPGRSDNPGNNFAASGGENNGQQGGGQQHQSRGNHSNNQGGGNGAQANRGPDTHQPGNNAFKRKGGGGGGGFGGGGKQRSGGGSRGGFVGPMDHSYRAPNGNVFDPSASTVEMGGRRSSHQGDSQPIDYSMGRAIPIKEGAPTRIYFFIEDLFFTAKIQETARKLGVKIAFIKNEKEQIATLLASPEDERPGLIVFDLSNANAKPMTLIPKLKAKLKKSTSIVGFLSTLQGELRAKAVEAGCDTVMPRAAFSQNLPNLLRRYGIEEVEDHTNFNQ